MGKPLPPDLLSEFYWRSGNPKTLLTHEGRFTPMQCVEAMRICITRAEKHNQILLNQGAHGVPVKDDWAIQELCQKSSFFRAIYQVVSNTKNPIQTEQELQDLITIAEVHTS